MSFAAIALPPDEFAQAFPFHLALDGELRIVQIGASLARVCPRARVGDPLADHFRIRRPHASPSMAQFRQSPRALYIMDSTVGALCLKGQMLVLPGDVAVFLCSPWVSSPAQLRELGLSLADFAPHDPMIDMLILLQSQQTAIEDTTRLSEQIMRANAQLEEKIREASAATQAWRESEAAQRTSATRLATLIGSMHAGVLVEDERRRVVLANQAFCEMFDVPAPAEALVGMECSGMADEVKHMFADPEGFVQRLGALLAERRIAADELPRADGRTYERDYVPIFVDGDYHGHLWLYRDISERKQFEAELAAARDAALESSRLKSQFLATVSHEIRTPLNGVIGMAELLAETPLSAEQGEFARTIEASAQALLAIINDILDYSKIEAGQMLLDVTDFSLARVVSDVSAIVRGRVRAKGLALSTEIAAGVPAIVRGDAGRLRQILVNLVSNAVKFTDQGRIDVRIEPLAGAALRFSVADTGIGIPAEMQGRLFQPFTQADSQVTRRYGGTGLGLAISKSLVELMGGAIGFESRAGEGSTFWLTLSFAPAADAPLPEQVGRQERGERQAPPWRGHLLLVEDHPVNQDIALRQLGRLGFTADVAGNGLEALAHLAAGRERYRLVLMDCHMPEMDGYACTRAIREAEGGAGGHIPIVAMTASAQQSDRDASMRAGMDDFLSKPVRQEALAAVLQRWLPDAPSQPPPPPPAPRPQPGALLDMAQVGDLRAFDADSPGAFDALCEAFFAECDTLLAALAASRAAGDLVAAREAAHRLRGSCLNMGAARLAELAAAAEAAARRGDDTALASSFDALLAAAPQTRQAIAAIGGRPDPLGAPEQSPRRVR